MIGAVLHHPRAFARDTRGGAAIELALGAVVLIASCAMCFDLYSRVRADTASARLASTMADYVSRETEPDGDDLKALGEFLYTHELKVPANLVYAITAFRRPPGYPPEPVEVLWSDASIRFGDETVTGTIADGCARHTTDDGKSALPGGFDMAAGEVLIIVEVCARLTREGSLVGQFIAGEIYRLHAVPAREPDTPPSPPAYERTAGLSPRPPTPDS